MMLNNKLLLVFIFLIFANCRNKNDKRDIYHLKNFNIANIRKASDCQNNLKTYGLVNDSLLNVMSEAKNRISEDDLYGIILMFYKETGDVINNYQTILLEYENQIQAITFLNNKKEPISQSVLKDFQIDDFYDSLAKVEITGYETDNMLMIFNFNNKGLACKLCFTRYEDGEKIKSLSFLN